MAAGAKKRPVRSDDELLKEALAQLLSAEQHMLPIMERIRRARLVALGRTHRLYGKPRDPSDKTDWHSRIFPPIANEQWELVNAEMTVDDPRFKWTPREAKYSDKARLAEQALDYYMDRDRFPRKFRLAMRAVSRDGGQVVKHLWAPDDYHEGGRLQNILVRAEDIFPDPTATDFDDCSFTFHKTRATTQDLYSRVNADGSLFYKNLDKLMESGGVDTYEEKREGETTEAYTARTTGMHTIHEKWTPFGRLTFANRTTVIRRDDKSPLPIKGVPFTMIRLIDDEDCIFGVSLMTLIDELQEAFWDLLNALFDAVALAVGPPMLVDVEEDVRSAEYDIRPHAKIPARNGESTVKIMQDIAGLDKYNISQLIDNVRGIMERITGMNSAMAGASQASTATEAAINVRQGKNRSGAMMNVSDECWSQVAEKCYAMVQEFASEDIKAMLSDGTGVEFSPNDLVDMFITPGAAGSERNLKDLERQDAQSAWGAVTAALTDPATQMPRVDPTPVLARLLVAFNIDPHSVIKGPPSGPVQAMPDPAAAGGQPTLLDASGNPMPVDTTGQPMAAPDAMRPDYQPSGPPRPSQFAGPT